MQITTERLLIRQFKQEDFPFVYAYVSDEETMHYLHSLRTILQSEYNDTKVKKDG
ncbi:hypothetical protein SPD48_02095 [Pseudogracilibacillus sp. SE30717A]|uniref:GNAT family N-acetyltransferase n=1 Tax=Pseudogracilibacillus sp. SE30717A TaxID=3098293 RepID=UPI00300E2271